MVLWWVGLLRGIVSGSFDLKSTVIGVPVNEVVRAYAAFLRNTAFIWTSSKLPGPTEALILKIFGYDGASSRPARLRTRRRPVLPPPLSEPMTPRWVA